MALNVSIYVFPLVFLLFFLLQLAVLNSSDVFVTFHVVTVTFV